METVRVVAGIERKRRFSAEQKMQIVEESYAVKSVPKVANRHQITAALLYKWRQQIKKVQLAKPSSAIRPSQEAFARVVAAPIAEKLQVIKISKDGVTLELPLNTDPLLVVLLVKKIAE